MIKNLTSHVINVFVEGEERLILSPSGVIPRCSQREEVIGDINGIPVTRQTFGEVVDLPAPEDGTWLIVSRLIAASCPERTDLLCPGPMVRGENGRPVGCNGLSKV